MTTTMRIQSEPTGTGPIEDILIINGRDKSTVIGNTPEGKRWIEKNMTERSPVIIDRDTVEEFIEYLNDAELTVDIK